MLQLTSIISRVGRLFSITGYAWSKWFAERPSLQRPNNQFFTPNWFLDPFFVHKPPSYKQQHPASVFRKHNKILLPNNLALKSTPFPQGSSSKGAPNLEYSHSTQIPILLRPYQEDCIRACLSNLAVGRKRQLVSRPVGSGKTVSAPNNKIIVHHYFSTT